jgi:predicted LPLAT superfamily acyltransferase
MVPVFARRVGFFDYEVRVRPALALPRSADAAARTAAAQATAAELEAFLSEDPTQWFRFAEAGAQMP